MGPATHIPTEQSTPTEDSGDIRQAAQTVEPPGGTSLSHEEPAPQDIGESG